MKLKPAKLVPKWYRIDNHFNEIFDDSEKAFPIELYEKYFLRDPKDAFSQINSKKK